MAKKSFAGKVAIVTGSSRGIGEAIALELGVLGAKVVLNGRDETRLIAVHERLQALDINSIFYKGDVSDPLVAQDLVNFALDKFGQIDILVNNLGISCRGNLADLHPSVLQIVFQSNIYGTIFPTQAALPALRQTNGSVVFISSLAAIHGLPGLAPYSASKMALSSFVDSLRIEEKIHNVHVGLLQVAMTEIAHNKAVVGPDGKLQTLAKRKQSKVLSTKEVAQDCVQLISKRKYKITQTTIGKLNRILNGISPRFVEWVLLKNMHQFEEQRK